MNSTFRNLSSRAFLLAALLSCTLAGCNDESGTVNLQTAKAAAQNKDRTVTAPTDRPTKPARDVGSRPKSAPARTSDR